ncbi:MAG: GspE/PulE family protein [Puniceicoccaceae bacterium]
MIPPSLSTTSQKIAEVLSEQNDALAALPYHRRQAEVARLANCGESAVVDELSRQSGLPVCNLSRIEPHPDLRSFPVRLIHALDALPVADPPPTVTCSAEAPSLRVLVPWIPTPTDRRWFIAETGLLPFWEIAPASRIQDNITRVFGVGSGSLLENEADETLADEAKTEDLDEEAAIVRFVNDVVRQALEFRATDIHFEPGREDLHIRYRVDGALSPVSVPEELRRFQSAVISRIKIMANLNISERRRPQDGRINFRSRGEDIDVRVSTFPTLYGESISLRLLNRKAEAFTIEDLGMDLRDRQAIEKASINPNGIILVTGPTGSGKSTTLNACLRFVSSPERRLITVEDPIEYEVPGVNQTQINEPVGLTFANALRHILRQDPDVIMVGEIRDRETADIAIRASLTGHLVFSTLHTNDAAGAITRLIDMEIEPFLIASAVRMVVAQRLIRRLCPSCSRPIHKSPQELQALRREFDIRIQPPETNFREAVGCERCRNLGYQGRIACCEILEVNDSIHDLVLERATARTIREAARGAGLRTLEESAWNQAAKGLSTIDEMINVIASST